MVAPDRNRHCPYPNKQMCPDCIQHLFVAQWIGKLCDPPATTTGLSKSQTHEFCMHFFNRHKCLITFSFSTYREVDIPDLSVICMESNRNHPIQRSAIFIKFDGSLAGNNTCPVHPYIQININTALSNLFHKNKLTLPGHFLRCQQGKKMWSLDKLR